MLWQEVINVEISKKAEILVNEDEEIENLCIETVALVRHVWFTDNQEII